MPPQQNPAAVPALPRGRAIGDIHGTRTRIFEKVLGAAQDVKPIKGPTHTLALTDVAYEGPQDFSPEEEKKAILEGGSLNRKLRGTWHLIDNATNQPVESRRMTVANVPYLTDRGTFVRNGLYWTLGHQERLRSGAFVRRKSTGEIEAHVNVLPGQGLSHRVYLEPDTGVFRLQVGQAKMPLFPLARALGAKDDQLSEAWGRDLFLRNMQHDDSSVLPKLRAKLRLPDDGTPDSTAVANAFGNMRLDPVVTRQTLGQPYDRVGLDQVLSLTKKLIKVGKGEELPDDRDHLAFMSIHGPEDLISERVGRDTRTLSRILRRSAMAGRLQGLQAGIFDKAIHAAIADSGLGSPSETVNPLMIHDQAIRVSRLGVGGIPDTSAIPDESRSVHPSQLGFIDTLVTPESSRAGVDSRFSSVAHKGDDGLLYAPFLNMRTRQVEHRTPADLMGKVIGFPAGSKGIYQTSLGAGHEWALVNGRFKEVPNSAIDYRIPEFEPAFGPVTNLVPFKGGIKGQRSVMTQRFITQALPLVDGEAPFVQSGIPGRPGVSYEDQHGVLAGAVRTAKPGVVVRSEPGRVVVRHDDGTKSEFPLVQHLPWNMKTGQNQTPVVRVGDRVGANGLLARSNFTDANGTLALGRNARVAYLADKGWNFEDAISISEGFAKKLTSDHYYQHQVDLEDGMDVGKNAHISLFPGKFPRVLLDRMDEDGVIRPGTTVNYGEPLVLAARKRAVMPGQVHRNRRPSYTDASELWTHHAPGVVTDVAKTKKGVLVVVHSTQEMKEGDKLCYDPQTDVLTKRGWVPVAQVTLDDEVCSLDPFGRIEYLKPEKVHAYEHSGRMYNIETTQVSLCVTDNHALYARPRHAPGYSLIQAQALYGKRYKLLRNGTWEGRAPGEIYFPPITVKAGQSGRGERTMPGFSMDAKLYAMLLGAFLSEGDTFRESKRGYGGIELTRVKPENRRRLIEALDASGLHYRVDAEKFRIRGKQLYLHFRRFGRCHQKYIPSFVFEWDRETLEVLYDWLMWGGGSATGTGHGYHTTSKRLADDFQRLLLHLGMSGNVDMLASRRHGEIQGRAYGLRPRYFVSVFRHKNRPEINHGHVKRQDGQLEQWVEYQGMVYCVTLPRNHVLYVRRHGRPVWCGNSGRAADKGVVARIIPDHEMPHDVNGVPYEVLINPLGIVTRCHDEQTEFLTETGWKFGRDVADSDKLVCYHPRTGGLFVLPQLMPFNKSPYRGKMLRFKNNRMDFCVTPNHRFWARCGYPGAKWQEVTASRLKGKGWVLPVAAQRPAPGVETPFELPHVDDHPKDTQSDKGDIRIDAGDWAEFLGWYMAEGNADEETHISQSGTANPAKCDRIAALLDRLPFAWRYNPENTQFRITSIRLARYLAPFGLCASKHLPEWLFAQPPHIRQRFLEAYWSGAGRISTFGNGRKTSSAGSLSPRLASDMQRLLIYQGISAAVNPTTTGARKRPFHVCARHFKKTRVLDGGKWAEVDYEGMIYCPTVPTGYVVTRRNGKVLFSGNSNPAQVVEAALGKIAEKTGQPYKVPDWNIPNLVRFAKQELARHGMTDKETVIDPVTGRQIPNVLTGNRFMLKLHHTSECYDDKTEVLTADGWKRWPDVVPEDELATVEDDRLIFEKPLRLFEGPSPGQLYCFEGRYIDYAVTGDHRHWVRYPHTKDKRWQFVDARRLHGRRFAVRQFGFPTVEDEAGRPAWECGVALTRTIAQVDGDRNTAGFSIRPYAGKVYCAEMRTGLLYVRRNGKPMLSGNSKSAGRGFSAYTAEGRPAKGGEAGAKKVSLLSNNALLSSGATAALQDAGAVRGQAHPDYWAMLMSGHKPPSPKEPMVWNKFLAQVQSAGINVLRDGTRFHIMAMGDHDVDQLAGDRNIENGETVDWKTLEPVPGGLFDVRMTGGHGGSRWSAVKLHEPMPSPVFEEPIRRMLGLTEDRFRGILAGKDDLNGVRGPEAIRRALDGIDIPRAMANAREEIKSTRGSRRDAAVRRLRYLKGAEKYGVHPRDWVLSRVPVLPPNFRPIARMGDDGLPLIADPNYLYKELIDANDNLRAMSGRVGDVGHERLALYDAFKGVTGLGDPTNPKNAEKGVKGVLRHVFGPTGPKSGLVQKKLISANVDLVGRAVITPDPTLDLDGVALPESRAWEVYRPFIVRRLVRRGMPMVQAAQSVKTQAPVARQAMLDEMKERPVFIDRAPVLHRYGVMAFWPKLTKGDVMKINPLVCKGFNADFDGDAMQFHVPGTDEAVKDAIEKMLPSKNLFAVNSFRVHQKPANEYAGGLYRATAFRRAAPAITFRTREEAISAYKRGEIAADQPVRVLDAS